MRSFADIFDPSLWPMQFEYMSLPAAIGLFLLLAAPVLWLGLPALRWQGTARQSVAIGARLSVLWLAVMILAGARWQRVHHDVEVMIMRDISASTASVPTVQGKSLQTTINEFLHAAIDDKNHRSGDSIGVVRLDRLPTVESLPSPRLIPSSGAISSGTDGTDIASAVQLAMSCFSGSAMRRLVLISDGNATQGDLQASIAAAAAARIPVDVIPLEYDVRSEVILERLIAPISVNFGQAMSLEAVFRSTHDKPVWGNLTITDQGLPIDLDPQTPGVQMSQRVQINPGPTPVRIKLPPMAAAGLHDFRASFQPESIEADTMAANNSAQTFSLLKGPSRYLLVENLPEAEGDKLVAALRAPSIGEADIQRIKAAQFPAKLSDLQSYDAIILANVPRGIDGLDGEQDRVLSQYVRDTGGGLVVIGGPDALGAGGWQGSEVAKILPIDLDVSTKRILPGGVLVLVLDHSGSMGQPMPKNPMVSKQETANESAVLAIQTLMPQDMVGVIAFDSAPQWVVPLALNRDPLWAAGKVRAIGTGGGTSIGPALDAAADALAKVNAEQSGVKRVLLLTDGRSVPYDYRPVLERLKADKVILSTIAVGGDADRALLADLATQMGGGSYIVDDPHQLKQVFVREARTLRRSLIHEPAGGVKVVRDGSAMTLLPGLPDSLPNLGGMVLTSRLADPFATVLLSAANEHKDPILAHRQAGLGRCVVFTSDAGTRWASQWVESGNFESFWTQVVRSVARPAMSNQFDMTVVRDGSRAKLVVEARDNSGAAKNFMTFHGRVAGPNPRESAQAVHLTQTGPARYEGTFDTPQAGNYVPVVGYDGPGGERGTLLAGINVADSPELRDLRSNNAQLHAIAAATGGRILPAFDPVAARLFAREGLHRTASSMPAWDILLAAMCGMVVLDVAARRIAWDQLDLRALVLAGATKIRSFTGTRTIEPTPTLDALKRVREEVAEQNFRVEPLPEKSYKFEAKAGVQGDITEVVGGATSKPIPAPPKKIEPKGLRGHTGSLLEAKRRAQQQIKDKEQGQE